MGKSLSTHGLGKHLPRQGTGSQLTITAFLAVRGWQLFSCEAPRTPQNSLSALYRHEHEAGTGFAPSYRQHGRGRRLAGHKDEDWAEIPPKRARGGFMGPNGQI